MAAQGAVQAASSAGVGMTLVRRTATGAYVFRLNAPLNPNTISGLSTAIVQADPQVQYVEPDTVMQIQATANDPDFPKQWHYHEQTAGINLPAAWDVTKGAGIVVAVIDTGFRPHADLAANLLPGYDFVTNLQMANDGNARDADAKDPGDWVTSLTECSPTQLPRNSSWHGTHVAGTIAAVSNNSLGGAGVAPLSKILPVRALGKCGGYLSDIADGIVWAVGGSIAGIPTNPYPAKVINMSLGGGGGCSFTYQEAIDAARLSGAVVVVAAGNSNTDAATTQPANCAGVITVGAIDRSGMRTHYSNYGDNVDISAPGGDTRANSTGGVYSTLNSGTTVPGSDSYAYYQGTSMAAPHVAGVAALVLSIQPNLSPDAVENLLKSTARAFPGGCSKCGAGIVDAAATVLLPKSKGKPLDLIMLMSTILSD
ncbi:MAG: S8 family serine peptidase [Rhizobacter sp.]